MKIETGGMELNCASSMDNFLSRQRVRLVLMYSAVGSVRGATLGLVEG